MKSGELEGEVMSLNGTYNHTIDGKGRLIVPSKFREELGENFVITKGLDGCLFVFPELEWKTFEEKLRNLPVANKDARKFARFFLAGASAMETDKQGRVLVPPHLREFAALEKDICFVGVSARAEIWDKSRWEDNSEFNDMDEIAEHMGEWGFGI